MGFIGIGALAGAVTIALGAGWWVRRRRQGRDEASEPFDPEREAARAAHAAEVARVRRAITTRSCPSCGGEFVGTETFKHSLTFRTGSGGLGGGQVYELSGTCARCGQTLSAMDMR